MAASFDDIRREGRADALVRLVMSGKIPRIKGEGAAWCDLFDVTPEDVQAAYRRRDEPTETVSRYARQADPKHGTISAYTNHSCRCEDCRKAMSRYNRERRARLRLVAS